MTTKDGLKNHPDNDHHDDNHETRRNVSFQRSQSDHPSSTTPQTPMTTTTTSTDHSAPTATTTAQSLSHSLRRMQSDDPGNSNSNSNLSGTSPRRRSRSLRYDASHAMDRLRSSFIAGHDTTPMTSSNGNRGEPPLSMLPPMSLSSSTLSSSLNESTANCIIADANNNNNNNEDSGSALMKRKSQRDPNATPTPLAGGAPSSLTGHHPRHWAKSIQAGTGQIPAIVLIGMFHLMIGIPFGVSYFPIGWRNDIDDNDPTENAANATTTNDNNTDAESLIHGPFPVPGKEALGIRMFLYSTIVAQLVFTWKSHFVNPIGLEMVENVPFYHELAAIAIQHCGYGLDALVTLFFMFGTASVLVGIVFYGLGRYELGRIVYFFPMHVLVGCIGGIGFYLCRTGLEVTMDVNFSLEHCWEHWILLRVTFLFELVLRILERVTLDADGKPRYTLLSPIYFCMITPVFYMLLWLCRVPLQQAREDGYFFPAIASATRSSGDATTSITSKPMWQTIFADEGMFDIWRILDLRMVSWSAMFQAIPTMVALTLFSLIHVPINIPAFGISTNADYDMNNELVAHGYSNLISGICGLGLQNYMAYTQSVVYDRSGGCGKRSGVAVAILTAALFVIGPTIASFIPKCMAGALLLHVGLDLFLEGVYDTIGKFDRLEYAGIWLIVIVMTLYGMEAAMIAGVIAAVSTYAMQSITYLNPIRGSMSAVTLRSSHRNRNYKATAVLNDPANGRSRIVVIQLQGHLFFGNLAQLNAGIDNLLNIKHAPELLNFIPTNNQVSHRRRIVVMDFSLVVGIDSSAAQGLIKLKNAMHKKYRVDVCIFVTGSEQGFPCEFDLSNELTSSHKRHHHHFRTNQKNKSGGRDNEECEPDVLSEATSLLHASSRETENSIDVEHQELMDFRGSFVLESLDLALIFAENVLIAWENPALLDDYDPIGTSAHFNPKESPSSMITDAMLNSSHPSLQFAGEDEEREAALRCLVNMCPDRKMEKQNLKALLSHFQRETYAKDEFIWKQNDASDCAKLLLSGTLLALLENEAGTSELVFSGNFVGELGLVQAIPRFSSVQCVSDDGAIIYSLSREAYEHLVKSSPHLARFIDLICIQCLANRVQHVSNRIFETRCLPI